MGYLIDSDVLIRAKNHEYGFDFCPAFWSWLEVTNADGLIHSVQAVYDELVALDDELSDWVKDHASMFLAPDEENVRTLGQVIRWANESEHYSLVAKEDFASRADSMLVAAAVVRGDTIVTNEVASDGRKSIKIPNAAAAHGIRTIRAPAMLRVERARFVLEGPA